MISMPNLYTREQTPWYKRERVEFAEFILSDMNNSGEQQLVG